jgi:hypothetical protein
MEIPKVITVAVILLALVFFITKKSKAQTTSSEVLITNFDTIWDYKRTNGVWYTRKKVNSPAGAWLDMKKSLSPENYAIAEKKLTTFLNRK